jgi:hypothetical protein
MRPTAGTTIALMKVSSQKAEDERCAWEGEPYPPSHDVRAAVDGEVVGHAGRNSARPVVEGDRPPHSPCT